MKPTFCVILVRFFGDFWMDLDEVAFSVIFDDPRVIFGDFLVFFFEWLCVILFCFPGDLGVFLGDFGWYFVDIWLIVVWLFGWFLVDSWVIFWNFWVIFWWLLGDFSVIFRWFWGEFWVFSHPRHPSTAIENNRGWCPGEQLVRGHADKLLEPFGQKRTSMVCVCVGGGSEIWFVLRIDFMDGPLRLPTERPITSARFTEVWISNFGGKPIKVRRVWGRWYFFAAWIPPVGHLFRISVSFLDFL